MAGDIIDMAEARRRRTPAPPQEPKLRLRIVDGEIEIDHPYSDVILVASPALARKLARALNKLARTASPPKPRLRPVPHLTAFAIGVDDQRGYVLSLLSSPDGAVGRRLDFVAGNMLLAAWRRCARVEPRY